MRPHNDLDGAAFYLQKVIRDKLAAKNQDALFYDCMACSTMIAFAFEAYLNFFGAELVESWDDWWSIDKKEKKVLKALKLRPKWKVRPFGSMKAMKELRNTFAHAKPQTFEMDEEVIAEVGELDGKRYDIGPKWEKDCIPVDHGLCMRICQRFKIFPQTLASVLAHRLQRAKIKFLGQELLDFSVLVIQCAP